MVIITMNAKIMIAFVAVFAMLFAGVAVANEVSADETGEGADTVYTVTYHYDGATKVVELDMSQVTAESPEALGFTITADKTFKEWNTSADGKGASVAVGVLKAFPLNTTSMDLYAIFEGTAPSIPEKVTVKFDVGGTIYSQTLDVVNGIVTLPGLDAMGVNAPAGKEFKGWFVDVGGDGLRDDGEYRYAAESTISYDLIAETYTADLVDIEYTVGFTDAEGVAIAGDAYATQTVIYNGTVTLPAVPAPATGFVAVGWTADGETILKAGETVSVTADMTFKAVYEKDLVMTFYVDGVITYTHAMTGFNYPTDPVKESFTFVGWAIDGEVMLKAHAGIDDLKALGLTADTAFTAVFEPAIYTVSFEVDGQIVATQTVKHGELATEPAFIPALEGMDFVEWDFDFAQAITGDTTISAVFEPTPEPEPTGLANPTVQIMAIVIGVLAVFVVAMLVWKKDEVRVIIVKKLDKTKNQEEPKQ